MVHISFFLGGMEGPFFILWAVVENLIGLPLGLSLTLSLEKRFPNIFSLFHLVGAASQPSLLQALTIRG